MSVTVAKVPPKRASKKRSPLTNMLKAKAHIVLTDPSGKKVSEADIDVEDPFTSNFYDLIRNAIAGGTFGSPALVVDILDIANNAIYMWTSPPYNSPSYTMCITNCANTSLTSYSLKTPGIWLYNTPPCVSVSGSLTCYSYLGSFYSNLITNVLYMTPSVTFSPAVAPGGSGTITITQQFTNTSSSTINVWSLGLVAAVYFYGYSTPVFTDIVYFNLSPSPIVWSPSAGLTVTITISVPE